MNPTALNVFYRKDLVGRLTPHNGTLHFRYEPVWREREGAFSLSMRLPLRVEEYAGIEVEAFFSNLLPEGNFRQAIARRLGLSVDNDFALLAAIGGECAGAFRIFPEESPPEPGYGEYRPLTDDELSAFMLRRGGATLYQPGGSIRLSLAGAQEKLPVALGANGSFLLPLGDAPTTHILKPPNRDFKHLPENESFMNFLASQWGMATVRSEIRETPYGRALLIERYDRIVRERRVIRIHQEDFCQLTGRLPKNKYEREGGPSFRDCVEIVRGYSVDPARDLESMLEWLLFNLLTGNSDGHAKNLSLLYGDAGARLAPFYDLVSTRAYPGIARELAMGIGSLFDPGQVGVIQLESEALEIGVRPAYLIKKGRTMAERLPEFSAEAYREWSDIYGEVEFIKQIVVETTKRCWRFTGKLKKSD